MFKSFLFSSCREKSVIRRAKQFLLSSSPETKRCGWSTADKDLLYTRYHDEEWGVVLHDDRKLFEFLVLEGAQAGLSWLTVLRKRENYRELFEDFDIEAVANYDKRKINSLLNCPGIIRNRMKIESAIRNARCILQVNDEFGTFDRYLWSFMPNSKQIKNRWRSLSQIPARTALSDLLSADLKKRGFSFVGSTICYAHMQATGMVNDHLISCFRYNQV